MARMSRRSLLHAGAGLAGAGLLAACGPAARPLEGGFTGVGIERGHALRERLRRGEGITPDVVRSTRVVIAGGGIAGLSAARSLRLSGIDDFVLLELEDEAGGNSRGTRVKGIDCPLGAHYLPIPGDDAREVQDFLEEQGLRRRVAGRWVYDEFALCHSPQERLFFNGHWQDGLLPLQGVSDATLAQYARFAQLVARESAQARFAMPTLRLWREGRALPASHLALDAVTMDTWLSSHGLDDPLLLWYLDYACRDDYGAGLRRVSAWAGIHYFASRHGFHPPGGVDADEEGGREAVLTWADGNGHLARALAAPLRQAHQLRTGASVLRIAQTRSGVEVDVYDEAARRVERWRAQRCVVALPVFGAARVVENAPDFLREAARRLQWAPWLVANIHIDAPLADRDGAAPSWDNVLFADPVPGGLGYVDAGHQRLDPRPAPTVLTYYQALGDIPAGRERLAQAPWTAWSGPIMASLSQAHPDLALRATRMDITRHGHAMSIPVPGLQGFLSRQGLPLRHALSNGERVALAATPATERLAFAHADWSGYSVFEEAFTRGFSAGALCGM